MKTFTLILILFINVNLILAQSYEFDKSFGDEGIVKVQCNSEFCVGYKIQLLDDGSFLLYSVYEGEETDSGFEIRKFDHNGNVNENFGDNGVFTAINSYTDFPLYHGQLSDNKIAVIDIDDNYENIRVRILNEKGEIEKTLSINLFLGSSVSVIKCLYKEGYLYLAGVKNEQDELFILKTDLNGKPDSTYAENGIFILKDNTFSVEFNDMEFQNNNLIVYSSYYDTETYSNDDVIFRLKQNGNFDNDFGTLGYFKLKDTDGFGDLSVDSKDRIIFTPFYYDVIYRLDENRLPDINFDKDGKVELNEISILGNYFFHNINSKDEILLFGSLSNDEYDSFGIPSILKINENGKKDYTFGSYGILLNSFDKLAVNYNGEILSNGDIITTGAYIENPDNGNFSMFLSRLKLKTSADNNLTTIQDLNIFPNPINSDKFTIQFPDRKEEDVIIRVIDVMGKNIMKFKIPRLRQEINDLTIPLPDGIQNGQYLIIVNDGLKQISKKIIVSR